MRGFILNDVVVEDGRVVADIRLADWKQIGQDISDKSKNDVLNKCIAVVQIGRFLLAMIARAAASLSISPLEYFTCAQVICALLVYVFWFDKPYDVQEPIRIRTKPIAVNYIFSPSGNNIPTSMFKTRIFSTRTFLLILLQQYIVTGYAAALVGASALGQWNALFSTPTSRMLWRTFSIVSAVLPLLTIIIIIAWASRERNTERMYIVLCSFISLNCLNRLILIYLVFYSFLNLPEDVYQTVNWLDFIAFIQ